MCVDMIKVYKEGAFKEQISKTHFFFFECSPFPKLLYMNKFIEVTGIQGEKYIINTNWIIYIEEIYNDESKTLIVLDKDVPICKSGTLNDPYSLYVKDEYKSLKDRLI